PEPPAVARFEIAPPTALAQVGSPHISPDGRHIVFWGTEKDGTQRIWLRDLEDPEAHPLAGSQGALSRPFWSPDSRYVGFMADGKLKKIPIGGGPPQSLCDAPNLLEGTWSPLGAILFDGWGRDPIRHVSPDGGESTPVIEPKSGEKGYTVGLPAFLPDGRHFLYIQDTSWGVSSSSSPNHLMLASLDGAEAPRKLLDVDSLAQYVAPGYLIFVRDDSLLAQPFDAKTSKLAGAPVPLVENLPADRFGLAEFSASAEGTLVYRRGSSARRRLVWVDRSGKEIAQEGEREWYTNPALSTDGKRLAVTIASSQIGGKTDIWLLDLDRGAWSRFTFESAANAVPLWSPDDRRIVFTSIRQQSFTLQVKPSSGVGTAEEIATSDLPMGAVSWSPDGQWLLVQKLTREESWNIMLVRMPGPDADKMTPFVATKNDEREPHFSPDGRWVLYESSESGRMEIYVRPFEGPRGKWQVSADGGEEPWWSPDGKEIFYVSPDSHLMAVPVSTGSGFSAGIPRQLFEARLWVTGFTRNRWVPAPDGKRFLLIEPGDATQPMTLVQNWPQLLSEH
ncbi:MAG TPA: hypothetical protein VNI57_02695, partial [Candidatus Saccharimonadales bacterium]|nr:hypothetical protein [Candidatus Saccharimonadales bacterium]